MCLLEERFDRQTGRCLAPLPEGWRPPIIHVTREARPGLCLLAERRLWIAISHGEACVTGSGFWQFRPVWSALDSVLRAPLG